MKETTLAQRVQRRKAERRLFATMGATIGAGAGFAMGTVLSLELPALRFLAWPHLVPLGIVIGGAVGTHLDREDLWMAKLRHSYPWYVIMSVLICLGLSLGTGFGLFVRTYVFSGPVLDTANVATVGAVLGVIAAIRVGKRIAAPVDRVRR